jgi:hypothetical protein
MGRQTNANPRPLASKHPTCLSAGLFSFRERTSLAFISTWGLVLFPFSLSLFLLTLAATAVGIDRPSSSQPDQARPAERGGRGPDQGQAGAAAVGIPLHAVLLRNYPWGRRTGA